MATLEVIVVVLLVLLNGFLAMSEVAIVSSRRTRLERLAADGCAGARAALSLADDPRHFLATVQVGLTTIGILAGAFSGVTLAHRLDAWLDLSPVIAPYSKPVAIAIVVICVTYLSLVVGELAPKQIALKDPEAIAVRVARPLAWFARITAPLLWLLNISAGSILGLLGMRLGKRADLRTKCAKQIEQFSPRLRLHRLRLAQPRLNLRQSILNHTIRPFSSD
jgi:putative hemolysin